MFNPNGQINILFAASNQRVVHQYLVADGCRKQINELLDQVKEPDKLAALKTNPAYRHECTVRIVNAILDGQPQHNVNPTFVFNVDTYDRDVKGAVFASGFITAQGLNRNADGSYRLALSVNLARLFPEEPAFKIEMQDGSTKERHANGFIDLSREKLAANEMLADFDRYYAEIEKGLEDGTILERDETLSGRLVLTPKEQLPEELKRGFVLNDLLFGDARADNGELLSGMFISVEPPRATQNELSRRINFVSVSFMKLGASSVAGAQISTVEEQFETAGAFGLARTKKATTAVSTTTTTTTVEPKQPKQPDPKQPDPSEQGKLQVEGLI